MPLDFRKNANVLTFLHSLARQKQRTPADPYVVDGYELHTHPDLADRLKHLAASVPDAEFGYAYGIAVLSTQSGKIFATAGGTHYLHLYLPAGHDWGKDYPEYGAPWRIGYAWALGAKSPITDQEIQALVSLAYSTALAADSVVNLP